MRKMLKKGIALLIAFLLLLCGVRMTEAAALALGLAEAADLRVVPVRSSEG